MKIFITILELSDDPKKPSDYYSTQQTMIVDLGIIERVAHIMHHSNESKDVELNELCLILLSKLVDKSNKYAQGMLLEAFSTLESGSLFLSIERHITSALESILDLVEQRESYLFTKSLTGKSNPMILERINVQFEIEKVQPKIRFVITSFNLMIALMKGNSAAREFMRRPIITESGKQNLTLTMIEYVVRIFLRMLKVTNKECMNVTNAILDFILECIIGPSPENQEEVMRTNFIDGIRELLFEHSEGIDLVTGEEKKKDEFHQKLSTKALVVARYLLEGNNQFEKTQQAISVMIKPHMLITKITNDLMNHVTAHSPPNTPFTMEAINRAHQLFEVNDDDLSSIYSQFFVLKNLLHTQVAESEFLESLDAPEQILAFEFLAQTSGSIEVVFENKIHKVFLEIQPLFRFMGKEETELVNNSVRRDTPKNKITDYLNLMPLLFDMISFKSSLKQSGLIYSESIYEFIEIGCFVLVLAINLLTVIFFNRKLDYGSSITDPDFDESHISIVILKNFHLVITLVRMIIFFMFENRLLLMRQWRNIFEEVTSKIRQNESIHNPKLLSLAKRRFIDLKFQEKTLLFAKYNQFEGRATNLFTLDYLFQGFDMIANLSKFKNLVLYFVLTVLAYNQQTLFFYSCLMLDIVNLESNMQNIVKSMTLNSKQFLVTIVFALLIVYTFSFLAFEIFQEDFLMTSIGLEQFAENSCQELKQCFYTIFLIRRLFAHLRDPDRLVVSEMSF